MGQSSAANANPVVAPKRVTQGAELQNPFPDRGAARYLEFVTDYDAGNPPLAPIAVPRTLWEKRKNKSEASKAYNS